MDDLEKEVFELIASKTGCKIDKLTLDSRINQDLGVDGADAIELMDAIQEKFHVDMADLAFSRHFGPEGFDLIYLIRWLLSAKFRQANRLLPLYVRDVVEAARHGRWMLKQVKR